MSKLFSPTHIADEVFKADHRPNIIKVTDERLDWNKIKFEKLDWDLEMRGLPWQVVRASYFVDGIPEERFHIGYPLCHCLGGRYGDNHYYAYPLFEEIDQEYGHDYREGEPRQYVRKDEGPTRENLIEFNADAPSWGIKAEETCYIRKGEIRNGGIAYILRNGKKFYEVRGSMQYALSKAYSVLVQLQDHPCNFNSRNWKEELEGRKVWYDNVPAIANHVIEDQGCLMIRPDPEIGIPFHPDPYMVENGEYMQAHFDEKDEVKVDYLYHKVNWFRSDQDTKAYIKVRTLHKSLWMDKLKEIFNQGKIEEESYYELEKILFHTL